MLTSTLGFSSQSDALKLYAKTVGAAAVGFIAALFAIKPGNAAGAKRAKERATARALLADELSLSGAGSDDVVSPELAKELRLIAARG